VQNVCIKQGFRGRANGIIQISVTPPLMPRQPAVVVWTRNRLLFSLHMRYHQDSSTKQVFWVVQFNCVSEICIRQNSCCHGNKNLQIFTQNLA